MFYLIDKNYKIEIINTAFDNLLCLKVFKWISALNSIIKNLILLEGDNTYG